MPSYPVIDVTQRVRALVGPAQGSLAPYAAALRQIGRSRLPFDAVLVMGGMLVLFRLMNTYPWNVPVLDMHAYWESPAITSYDGFGPFVIGAYLYSPAFAQLLAPLTYLTWPTFAGLWTAILLAAYVWMAGRWSLVLLASVAVVLELFLGQIDLLIAAAIVIGFRYPVAWAFPILTKVAPGIGLLWFAFRKEWRNLMVAITATVGIAAISAILEPALWRSWFDLLLRSVTQPQPVIGTYLALPLWLRLPAAIGLLWWGARSDRYWTVPVAVFLTMPILWLNVFTILVAAVPLMPAAGRTPAREWLLQTRSLPRRMTRRVSSRQGEPHSA